MDDVTNLVLFEGGDLCYRIKKYKNGVDLLNIGDYFVAQEHCVVQIT